MLFVDILLAFTCVAATACIVLLFLRLSKTRDLVRRANIKKMMVGTLAGMIAVVLSVVIFVAAPATVQAASESRNQAALRNSANYTLAQNTFDYLDSPFVLDLRYRGAPVIDVIEWTVHGRPQGVIFADVSRVNGQYLLNVGAFPPRNSYELHITATVKEGDYAVVSVPLIVYIVNGSPSA